MNSIDRLQQRILAARERLHRIPATGPGELGAPDPATGERWNRGNVLGHVAEMVPFWTDQAAAVLAGAKAIGRDEPGAARRQEGIARGTLLPEADLRAEIERGLDDLSALLRRVAVDDLERPVVYRPRKGPEEPMTLAGAIDTLLVHHLEEHLDQLEALT